MGVMHFGKHGMQQLLISILLLTLPGATLAATVMEKAAQSGDADRVRSLLAQGTAVDARYDIGRTALMMAAIKGRTSVVEALLDAGADPNLQDNNEQTALMLAAEYNQLPVVKTLVHRGANPSIKTRSGFNARELAERTMLREKDPTVQQIVNFLARAEREYRAPPSNTAKAAAPASIPAVAAAPEPQPTMIIELDASRYNLTDEIFQPMASKTLMRRGWSITRRESDRVGGSLEKKGVIYRAEIRHLAPKIQIYFLTGYASERVNWLRNLEKDLKIELESLPARR